MKRRVILISCIIGATACGGDEPFAPEDVAGTYALLTVDGRQVPTLVVDDGPTYSLEVTGGSLVLNLNRSCTSTIFVTETVDGQATSDQQTAACTYIPKDGGLELGFPLLGALVPATVVGSTITYTDAGSVWVFGR